MAARPLLAAWCGGQPGVSIDHIGTGHPANVIEAQESLMPPDAHLKVGSDSPAALPHDLDTRRMQRCLSQGARLARRRIRLRSGCRCLFACLVGQARGSSLTRINATFMSAYDHCLRGQGKHARVG